MVWFDILCSNDIFKHRFLVYFMAATLFLVEEAGMSRLNIRPSIGKLTILVD